MAPQLDLSQIILLNFPFKNISFKNWLQASLLKMASIQAAVILTGALELAKYINVGFKISRFDLTSWGKVGKIYAQNLMQTRMEIKGMIMSPRCSYHMKKKRNLLQLVTLNGDKINGFILHNLLALKIRELWNPLNFRQDQQIWILTNCFFFFACR